MMHGTQLLSIVTLTVHSLVCVYRVHRQLVSMFARGPEPTEEDSASSSLTSMDHPPQDDRGDQDDLIPSPK